MSDFIAKRISPSMLSASRALRRDATDAERKLWSRLRMRRLGGFHFRRQRPFGGRFILDFFCAPARLVVELDGGGHATEKGMEDGRTRDAALRAAGLLVVRYWNDDVLLRADDVLADILCACRREGRHRIAPSPQPPPSGRGSRNHE